VNIYRRNDTPAGTYQHLELLNHQKSTIVKNGTEQTTKGEEISTNSEQELQLEEDDFNYHYNTA
jgi:ribosome-associated heat shock protein Hsp15